MRRILSALTLGLFALATAAPAARAATFIGIDFNGVGGTIDGHTWSSQADAHGLTVSPNFQTATYGFGSVIPSTDDTETAMLTSVIYLPFSSDPGTISQTVANGQAYDVTLYYFEGSADDARAFSIAGDISAPSLGKLGFGNWAKTTLTTGVIADGSIDFTMTILENQPVLSGMTITPHVNAAPVPLPASATAGLTLLSLLAAPTLLRRLRHA